MHRHASVCNVFTISSPSSSPVDPETGADATEYDYVTDDPSSCATELPGKPPPLITRYRLFFSILLALEECSMLLHSLSLLLQLLPLPAILLLSIGC